MSTWRMTCSGGGDVALAVATICQAAPAAIKNRGNLLLTKRS
jgi:hypothetical protein